MTENYLEALAQQCDCGEFDRVLAKVPSVPADPWDEETPSGEEPAWVPGSKGDGTE